jgi:hypothetical protein
MKHNIKSLAVLAKQNLARVGVVGAAVLVSGAAMAADDPGVAAITALSAQAGTYITATFGVAVVIAAGFWGVTFMKKAFTKAG